jgi:hypothetical protein
VATASNERASGFTASNLIDGRPSTFWSTDDAVTAAEVTLKFQQRAPIQIIRLREHIALGQRVDSFALDSWQDSNWQILFEGTSIGPCRLIPLTTALITDKIRLRITAARASPTIEEFSVFAGVPALAASIVRENIEWKTASSIGTKSPRPSWPGGIFLSTTFSQSSKITANITLKMVFTSITTVSIFSLRKSAVSSSAC